MANSTRIFLNNLQKQFNIRKKYELARMLGVSPQTLSGWLKNDSIGTAIEKLLEYQKKNPAQMLVPLDYLLKDHGAKKKKHEAIIHEIETLFLILVKKSRQDGSLLSLKGKIEALTKENQ